MAKNLTERLIEALPDLANDFSAFHPDRIYLRNDSDGAGDYIEAWNYLSPLPEGFTVGK